MRILVVDDIETNRKLLGVILTSKGHEVVEAADGVEALEKLHSGGFDAVITDILMPRMDGYRLCYKIRSGKALKDVPVILYSSTYTSTSDEQLALKVGADRFLRKPAAPAEILRALEEAIHAPRPRAEAVAPGAELEALKEYSEGLVRRLAAAHAELDTAQRRLTAAHDLLRESEKAFREIVDLAPTGIVRTTPAGKVLAANAAFAGMLGFGSAQELLGLDVGRDLYFDPAERAAVTKRWAGARPAAAIEFRLKRRDGTPFWVQGDGRAVRDSSGDILRYEVFVQDIDHRKKAEETQARLAAIVEFSDDAIIAKTLDGIVTAWNAGAERLFGYPAEEAIGRPIGFHVPADRADEIMEILERLRRGERVDHFETVRVRKDGTPIDVSLTVSPIRNGAGEVIGASAIARDITERKRSEAALRESEARQHAVFDSALDALITMDHEGRVAEFNPAAERIFQYSREEVVGKSLADLIIPPSRRESHRRGVARHIATGETVNLGKRIEVSAMRKDGTEFPAELAISRINEGGPAFFTGHLRDLTEQKRVQKEILRSEERFRKLFESNTIGIAVADLAGRTLEANDAYLTMIGYTRDELLSGEVQWDTMTPSEFKQRDQVAVAELQQTGAATPWEKEFIRKDGSRVPVLIGVAMLQASEASCIAYTVDLSQRRQLEEQFRQAQKMEAVGQLAGGVAHDFNNLLTAILGYSDLLARRLEPGSAESEDVDEIRKAGERAASLTRQLLAFSRQQVLERKVLDLNSLIADVEKMLRRLIGADIALVSVLDPALRRVWADAGQLEQVVMNLAVNARDAMPLGGRLTIETANVELDEAYARRHATVRAGSFVMLAVSDSGTGMDAGTLRRVFEPFFTTKERGKGTGLGLATVYGIVKQSGGHIWVYSELGKGTTFKIYLPPAAEGASPEEVPVARVVSLRGSETVLLAEDEASVRALSRVILENYGYTVLEAASGEEAVEIVRNFPGMIDLVLTDVVMPSMGGSALVSRVEKLRPGIKVLYMSGYTDDTVIRHGHLEPGRVFLQKPFTPESLARKVREALGG